MTSVVIQHVRVSELPPAWQASLHADWVTVRIDEETKKAAPKLAQNPLFGLWSDRDDIKNIGDYVRQLRKPHHQD